MNLNFKTNVRETGKMQSSNNYSRHWNAMEKKNAGISDDYSQTSRRKLRKKSAHLSKFGYQDNGV